MAELSESRLWGDLDCFVCGGRGVKGVLSNLASHASVFIGVRVTEPCDPVSVLDPECINTFGNGFLAVGSGTCWRHLSARL